MEYRWHVLRTNPRQETVAASGLVGHGLETYFPQIKKDHRPRRGAPRSVMYAMFPSYIFCLCTPDDHRWSRLWTTPGLRGILRIGETLAVISNAELNAMKSKELELINYKEEAGPTFKAGDVVRLQDDSAFRGQLCNIEKFDSDARIVILLNLFGRVTRATVRSNQLEQVR